MARYVARNETGHRIGETHPRSTISDATVDAIREHREDRGWSYPRISRKFGLPYCTIEKICRYERRAQTPESWARME